MSATLASLTLFVAVVLAAGVYSDGFESGDTSAWDGAEVEAGNTLAVTSAAAHTGAFGIRSTTTGTNDDANVRQEIPPTDQVYVRAWVKLLADVGDGYHQIILSANTEYNTGYVGALAFRSHVEFPGNNWFTWAGKYPNGNYVDTNYDFATGNWQCVELFVKQHPTDGILKAYVDGSPVAYRTGIAMTADPITWIRIGGDASDGITGSVISDYYFDDINVDDTLERSKCVGDDFENGNLSRWTNSLIEDGNILEVTPTAAGFGTYGIRVETGGTNDDALLRKNIEPTNEIFLKVWFKLVDSVSTGYHQVFMATSRAPDSAYVGALALRSFDGNSDNLYTLDGGYVDTVENLPGDTWMCGELYVKVSPTAGVLRAWIDGTMVADHTGLDTGTTPVSWLRLGADATETTAEYYFDAFQADENARIPCGTAPTT